MKKPRKKPTPIPADRLRKLADRIDRITERGRLTKADKRALEAVMPGIDPRGN